MLAEAFDITGNADNSTGAQLSQIASQTGGVLGHLEAISGTIGCRISYLSHDLIRQKTA